MNIDDKKQQYLTRDFGFLTEPELRKELSENSSLMQLPAKKSLLQEGEYIKALPLVIKGSIKVFREDADREILLYYITPQESCIMCIASAINNEQSKIKMVVEEDSDVIIIPARFIGEWFRKYNSWNRFVINLYKKRFESVLDAFNEVAFQQIDQRLIKYLQKKAMLSESDTIWVTHRQIADELGTAREVISRTLKQFEKKGKIKLRRGRIKIIDLK